MKTGGAASPRSIAGLGSILALLGLHFWTSSVAKIQETSPQLLQVYTRSAFYGIIIVGLLFGCYVISRAMD